MELAVVSYPRISKDDYDCIQAIRTEHDDYNQLIALHFTFVFPCNTEQAIFTEHLERQTGGAKKIPFVVRCAVVFRDTTSDMAYVFLVPDEGFSDIVKLHDRLYTGVLASELRLDIPFIPHIGIGNAEDPQVYKRLADDLNGEGFAIEGVIDTLEIVSRDRSRSEIKTIQQVRLT